MPFGNKGFKLAKLPARTNGRLCGRSQNKVAVHQDMFAGRTRLSGRMGDVDARQVAAGAAEGDDAAQVEQVVDAICDAVKEAASA